MQLKCVPVPSLAAAMETASHPTINVMAIMTVETTVMRLAVQQVHCWVHPLF